MANKYRGEITIKLPSGKYIMRPTFNALCEIETAIDKSLIILLSNFESKGISINEQHLVIEAGIKAGGQPAPLDLNEELMKLDAVYKLSVVSEFLQKGLNLS
jgi:hypothetical protein